jgi:chemotaxis protein methyltransferase CheR
VPIRIWSAACSTGQEVYSIAIALREALGNLNNFQISILGTDISDEAVTRASYGKYNKFEIERGLPAQTLNRYFTLMGDGWKIKDEIRAMAVFKKFNLMKPFTGLGRFDVVFCRNVAIYFTPMDKKLVFEKIAGVLEPDGSLVIGSTESLTGVTEAFEPRRYMRAIFYQPAGAPAGRFAAGAQTPSQPLAPRPVPAAPPAPPAASARPMGPPRSASVAAPAAPRPAPKPAAPAAAPRPEPPRPAAPAPPVMAAATPLEPETEAPGEAAPAIPRRAPVRSQPAQVYRAGDKSDLKRLLMQKKQKAAS